jgi:sensor histidine kinase regulating citrate/malate metabolism
MALKEAGIESPEFYISRVDLSTLATTIIENAVAHAFCGGEQDYKLLISFSFDKEKSSYIIDFTNNGEPMPLGMDKFRYGLKGEKGAKSNGSGLGGYRVKSITRHFGGDFDVFSNRANKLTTIRVTFPKHNKHEQV